MSFLGVAIVILITTVILIEDRPRLAIIFLLSFILSFILGCIIKGLE